MSRLTLERVNLREAEAAAMPERGRHGLQQHLFSLTKAVAKVAPPGWEMRSYHVFDSRKTPPGFPDLEIVVTFEGDLRRHIYAELKREDTWPSEDQRWWLTSLAPVCYRGDLPRFCHEVYLWRPRHYLSGEVEGILRWAWLTYEQRRALRITSAITKLSGPDVTAHVEPCAIVNPRARNPPKVTKVGRGRTFTPRRP